MTATSPPRTRTHLAALALAVAAGVWVGGCGEARTRVVLTGSSTVAPLAAALGKQYEARHPEVRIEVQTGGSSRGILDARRGRADLGMVSRALKPDEGDLTAHAIARDGIALIVHASNPVPELTRDQVVALYTGGAEDWRAVGGPAGPVTVVHKAEGRSTHELFLGFFALAADAVAPDVVIGDNEQGLKTVAGNPGAIGYVSIGAAEVAARQGVAIRLLPMDGVPASTASLRAGRFPLARPLNLVTRGQPGGAAADFLAYARSPDAHAFVTRLSFVPVE